MDHYLTYNTLISELRHAGFSVRAARKLAEDIRNNEGTRTGIVIHLSYIEPIDREFAIEYEEKSSLYFAKKIG